MTAAPLWAWIAFIAVVLVALGIDLGLLRRGPREMRMRQAAAWTLIWVMFAVVVAIAIVIGLGKAPALAFAAGYLVEESLSVDNLFVFVMIFAYFKVPRSVHHRVLFYGVLGALIMRGVFIAVGAVLFVRFQWVSAVFGIILVATGVRTAAHRESSFDASRSRLVRWVRRAVPMTDDLRGDRLMIRDRAGWTATPLLLVLILLEVTDIAFAVDSIPATFGVTHDAFIVFTSNICAVLGLRALYGLVATAITRFALLRYGVAIVLTFIGAKMLAEPLIHVDVGISLAVIVVVLAISILASLRRPAPV